MKLSQSVNFAKGDKTLGMNKVTQRAILERRRVYGAVFAGRHGDGYTFGTIGKGDFKCTEDGKVCEITKANRDVSTPSSFDYAYNIKEIRAKWSQIDDATREKAIENLQSGKFFENTINEFTDALGNVKDAFKSITPDFLWPKASESPEVPEAPKPPQVHEEEVREEDGNSNTAHDQGKSRNSGKEKDGKSKGEHEGYKSYQIKDGDTLSEIAMDFGVSVDDLMAANDNIENPNMIYSGQVLNIPKGKSSTYKMGKIGSQSSTSQNSCPWDGNMPDFSVDQGTVAKQEVQKILQAVNELKAKSGDEQKATALRKEADKELNAWLSDKARVVQKEETQFRRLADGTAVMISYGLLNSMKMANL